MPASFLGLPASLLLLLSAQIRDVCADIQPFPTAIRKMGLDAEEKLLHEYLAFREQDIAIRPGTQVQAAVPAPYKLTPAEEALLAANSSASIGYRAPLAAHLFNKVTGALDGRDGIDPWESFNRARMVEARLARRDFACPTGTSSCASIGYPNSCCQTGNACLLIEDTGLGPVGCCPSGQSCTGTIACSGEQQGCSSGSGGGCCIPGWSCASIGCTQSGTAAATTTTVTSTSTSSQLTTTSSSTSPSSSPTTTSTTSSPSTTTSSSVTSTGDASAPVRPTSGSTTSTPPGYCPTGFYACSAVYGGGCCQTGRDCQTTNCPSTAYTTVISSGVTIAVPTTDVPASATTTGTCAGGWSLCPTDAGPVAGCCPGGYECGTASCFLATGSATASVAKELPDSGAVRNGDVQWAFAMVPVLLSFAFGIALI